MKGETSAIRFSEAQKLLNYGFKNFEYSSFSKKGDVFKNILVDKGTSSSINVVFENDTGTLIPKGNSKNLTTNVELIEKISAPISKGQIIGKITYMIDSEAVAEVNLVADKDVKKLNLPNMMAKTFEDWFSLLR